MRLKYMLLAISSILIFLLYFEKTGYEAQAAEPVIIVLDPGHGGENLGAEQGEYTEKEMTMIVARAMKAELEQYEGVTVYLTHDQTDVDMTLKERAEFASKVKADMLFCLHFNMSSDQRLYGAEVWTSAFDKYYARGHAFAEIEMEMLSGLGIYSRGIKTRLNNAGEDYYGIIRESRTLGLTAVLIEHCHLDHRRDREFYTGGVSQWEELGRLDATAAAKFFRLRSEALGVDYSDYSVPEVDLPNAVVKPDLSPPDVCLLEIESVDETAGEANVSLTAQDYESNILYYTYSIDGGENYAELEPFPENETALSLRIALPREQDIELRAVVYNAYDRTSESTPVEIAALPAETAEEETGESEEAAGESGEKAGESREGTEEESEAGTREEDGQETTGEAAADVTEEDIGRQEQTFDEQGQGYIDISVEGLTEKMLKEQKEAGSGLETYQLLVAIVVSLIVLVTAILVSRIIMARKIYHKKKRR